MTNELGKEGSRELILPGITDTHPSTHPLIHLYTQ
jgi:hypothetical protein